MDAAPGSVRARHPAVARGPRRRVRLRHLLHVPVLDDVARAADLRRRVSRRVLHPTVHDEPALRFSIFDQLFRAPDAFALSTPEEIDLIARRFHVDPVGAVIGIGVEHDTRRCTAVSASSGRRVGDAPYLLYVGRVDEGKGAVELYRNFVRVQAATNPSDLQLVYLGERDRDAARASRRARDRLRRRRRARQRPSPARSRSSQPSYFESFSMILTEAFAQGRPALVQARSEVLIGHAVRSSAAIPYADAAEFEAALGLLEHRAGLADALGANGPGLRGSALSLGRRAGPLRSAAGGDASVARSLSRVDAARVFSVEPVGVPTDLARLSAHPSPLRDRCRYSVDPCEEEVGLRFRAFAGCLLLASTVLPAALAAPASAAPPAPVWSHTFGGWNRSSSPTIADVNGDGRNDIVHGHQDGYVRVLDAATGTNLPGWPQRTRCVRVCRPRSTDRPPSATSTRDGTNEVVVPGGSTWKANQPGGIVVFRRDGSIRCRFETRRRRQRVGEHGRRPTATRTACTRRPRSATSTATTIPTSCSVPGTCASTRSIATATSCPASP